MIKANVQRFHNFIHERHSIYLRRFEDKQPKPWTKDLILRSYRFCNIYRELDTVTAWIAKQWRDPNQKDPDLWFAMFVARFVNWPPTIAEIGYPIPWSAKKFIKVLNDRAKRDEKVYTGAYMIRADEGCPGYGKAEYLALDVLTPMWERRKELRPMFGEPLQAFFDPLLACNGVGSFMAAQVVADLKYAKPYTKAPDWWTFAASGPGSRRGLNRIMGYDLKQPWNESAWHKKLIELHQLTQKKIQQWNFDKLHAQDLQNCLCEFDKYERVRLGEGRPRSLFDGGK